MGSGFCFLPVFAYILFAICCWFLQSKFVGINFKQYDHIVQQKRPENQPDKTKQAKAYNDTEDGNNRMYISKFFQQGNPGNIVDVPGKDEAV